MSREFEATAQLAPCPHCGESHDEDSLRCSATDMLLPLEGRRLDGKFRFLSALGAGGMASVYLAVNERVDREVAIKFLRPEVGRDSEAVARFRSEAKAAGRIGNAHICEILDLGESPIGPYIVMERLRGIDLAALIRRQVRLTPGYAVRVVRHALEGLAAAHEAGIVHRDLKPGNIFLHRTDNGDTIVKLMDFGVSKFLDGTGEAETASGILLGTPEYMAPEQLEGAHKIGRAADIWAMGAILYRGITGHQVFSGPNLAAVLRSMALDEVTPVSKLVEGVPPELEAVIHRCLERDPTARYPTSEALSEALAGFEELDIEVVPLAVPAKTLHVPMSSSGPAPAAASQGEGELELGIDGDTQIWKEGDDTGEQAVADEPAPQPGPPPSDQPNYPNHPNRPVQAEVVKRKRKRVWVAGGFLTFAVLAFGASLLFGPRDGDADQPADLAAAETGPAAVETGAIETGALASDTGALASDTLVLEDAATETGDALGLETESSGEAADETSGLDELDELDETETDGADETDGDGAWVAATDRPAPSGTVRGGAYITLRSPGSSGDLNSAKAHCDALAAKSYAGVSTWKLANPSQLRKFIGVSAVKRSRYWTSALHDGRALVFTLPAGKKSSEKADRKVGRPLCVAKY